MYLVYEENGKSKRVFKANATFIELANYAKSLNIGSNWVIEGFSDKLF